MNKPKTLLELIHQVGMQSNEMAAKNLIESIETSAAIVANSVSMNATAETVQSVADTMVSTYYNQSKLQNFYGSDFHPEDAENFIDDAQLYVDIASSQPTTYDSITIGDRVFVHKGSFDHKDLENAYKQISIGNSSYIYLNVWKVVDGVLRVAVPWLYMAADLETGVCSINAGGLVYKVPVFDPVAKMEIKSATVTAKEGFTSDAVVDGNLITATFGHATQALAITLEANGEEILDTSKTIFRYEADTGNVGITKPETIGGIPCTYAMYMIGWKNEPVSEEVHKTLNRTLLIPGVGNISFNVNVNALVEA